MAYGIEYAIIAGGLHHKGEGTSHIDALYDFIENPPIHAGYHNGRYVVTEGEQIVVIGPTQENFSSVQHHKSHLRNAANRVAEGGKGIREARKRLEALQERPEPTLEQTVMTFTMRSRQVMVALSPETLTREAAWPDLADRIREVSGDCTQSVLLKVNAYRMFPEATAERKVLTGVPERIDDNGVLMPGGMVPWHDIVDVVPATDNEPQEVTA